MNIVQRHKASFYGQLLTFLNQHIGKAGLLAFANAIIFAGLTIITPERNPLFLLALIVYAITGFIDILTQRIQVQAFSKNPAYISSQPLMQSG